MMPIIDGKVHRFHAGGLYNGLILLRDEETGSYWDHITGEAVHGTLKGTKLAVAGITITDVKTARVDYPDIHFINARPQSYSPVSHAIYRFFQVFYGRNLMKLKGFYPPGFRKTLSEMDTRLPDMTQGLGIFEAGKSRFYPYEGIGIEGFQDEFNGRTLIIQRRATDRMPFAIYENDNQRPMQLFSRWYGFSLTFPETDIYGQDAKP